jgi:predicted TIM-barrel fold metal-dependent hydrolase
LHNHIDPEEIIIMTVQNIVDAHHHIWTKNDLDWLKGPMVPRIFGPYEAIRRDYLIDEFRQEVEPCGVIKSVYSQVNYPLQRVVEEVRWVQEVAEQSGWPHAIVGCADLLDAGAGCADTLQQQARIAPLMRGIRLQLHWHENETYRFAACADLMNDVVFRRNLARLMDYDWLFELQVFSGQMADAAALVAAFPAINFVLMHAGMLEDTSESAVARWRSGMQRLAEQENVFVKLSGLGTFVHQVDAGLIGFIVGETLERFGSQRCMYGGNFPVEKLWTGYREMLAAYRTALAGYDEEVQQNVFRNTAERIYRI